MTTLFDVGDEISVRLTGKVLRYTADRNGDAYTVALFKNGEPDLNLWVCIGTEELIAGDAMRVNQR